MDDAFLGLSEGVGDSNCQLHSHHLEASLLNAKYLSTHSTDGYEPVVHWSSVHYLASSRSYRYSRSTIDTQLDDLNWN